MMKLIYMVVLIIGLIDQTLSQTVICNTVEGYDIKTLTRARQWTTMTDYQCLENRALNCTFYFSFCRGAPMCHHEYSACQNVTGSTNMTILANHTTTQFFTYESDKPGFYAKFPPGPLQNISNTTECVPSLRINFQCNPDAVWMSPVVLNETLMAPDPIDVDVDPNDNCSTIMTFDYAGACLPPVNGVPSTDGLGPGAIFLIVIFSSALVYFLVGIIYNAFVKHRSGINLIPHAQFWIGLPLYVIEGCRASITCCSSTQKPSRATYESV